VRELRASERHALELSLVAIALAAFQVVLLWGRGGGLPAALAAGQLAHATLDLVNRIRAMYEVDRPNDAK
jgi:hypothetical protein